MCSGAQQGGHGTDGKVYHRASGTWGQVRGLPGGDPVRQHCPVQVPPRRHGIGKTAFPGARAQRSMVPGRVCKGDNDIINGKVQTKRKGFGR